MKCTCAKTACLKWIRENPLMIASLCAVILGITLGFSLRPLHLSDDVITWLEIWGELFLRMLKMLILPLIVCSLVVGVASMDGGSSGKLGGLTLGYIFFTQFVSTALAAIMAAIIKPGAGFGDSLPDGAIIEQTSYTNIFTDLFRNIFPDNIVQACIQSAYTSMERPAFEDNGTLSQLLGNDTAQKAAVRKLMYRDGMNIMGIVSFGLMVGVAICAAGDAGKPLYKLFVSLNHVIMKIMTAVMWYSPIGICSLITAALLKVDDMSDIMQSLGLFVGTFLAATVLHQFIFLPALYLLICRKNPFTYFLGIFDAFLAGLAPPSSAVAMPYLLKSCPGKLGVDPRVAQFVIPLEVTLNRDGSALFICVCTMFVAQSYSIALSVGHQIMLIFLITILVAAAAMVPSSSIVVLVMVASAVGLPMDERLGLFMTVEWLTDRVRTGTNIASHGYGCAIINSLCHKYLTMFRKEEYAFEEILLNGNNNRASDVKNSRVSELALDSDETESLNQI